VATYLRNCGTATCAPCCGTSSGLQCRTRGGTASLIGYSEYTTPSTPAKKYLVQTYTSDRARCSRNTNCAGSIQGSDSFIGNEVCTYNSTTAALTSTGSTVTRQTFGSCPATSIISTAAANCSRSSLDSGGFWNYTTQNATSKITEAGACGINESGYYSTPTGGETLTLTSEDTETNAVTRLLAGSGGTWGSFTTVGDGTSGTCLNTVCCNAKQQTRTTGFTFNYTESSWRVNRSGLTASTTYTIKVTYYRRTYGDTGAGSAFAEYTGTASTDGAGVLLTTAVNVPLASGFETYAGNLRLCV